MDQKWIQMLAILVFYQRMAPGAGDRVVKERERVEIQCKPSESFNMVVWFRVLDGSGMQFIASFARDGKHKSTQTLLPDYIDSSRAEQHILVLKSFRKDRDSGAYSCACMASNELKFGSVTRLTGEKKAEVITRAPAVVTTPRKSSVTPSACACKGSHNGESSSSLQCPIIILGPLAGGCGLLLLLLIITSVYCNRIRTRRCPHHYRRKPHSMAPGKQMRNHTHV